MSPTPEQWARLEELRGSLEFCCVSLDSDYNFVWDVFVTREDDAAHERYILSGPYSYEKLGNAIDAAWRNWKSEQIG